MLLAASLLHPIGFTLGLRPPPSTRSRSLQMTSDLERILIEQREVEDRILRDLRECNKIQSDNMQILVSLPDPRTDVPLPQAPRLHHLSSPTVCEPNSHRNCGMQREINEDMKAHNEAIDRKFESLQRMVLELLGPTAAAPSSLPTPPSSSSPEGG